jgi:hypothetical protein
MVVPLHRNSSLETCDFFRKKLGGGFKQEVREEIGSFERTEETGSPALRRPM